MSLSYTLGEKLGLFPAKPEPTPQPTCANNGDEWSEPCPCGNGNITYTNQRGAWVANHSMWSGASNFGKLEYVPCCKKCEERENARLKAECLAPFGCF